MAVNTSQMKGLANSCLRGVLSWLSGNTCGSYSCSYCASTEEQQLHAGYLSNWDQKIFSQALGKPAITLSLHCLPL